MEIAALSLYSFEFMILFFAVKSTKDLKNSRAFQNTAAATSEDDSQFKGMTPVSRGTRNTMNIRTQRANFAITNERLVVSGDR